MAERFVTSAKSIRRSLRMFNRGARSHAEPVLLIAVIVGIGVCVWLATHVGRRVPQPIVAALAPPPVVSPWSPLP